MLKDDDALKTLELANLEDDDALKPKLKDSVNTVKLLSVVLAKKYDYVQDPSVVPDNGIDGLKLQNDEDGKSYGDFSLPDSANNKIHLTVGNPPRSIISSDQLDKLFEIYTKRIEQDCEKRKKNFAGAGEEEGCDETSSFQDLLDNSPNKSQLVMLDTFGFEGIDVLNRHVKKPEQHAVKVFVSLSQGELKRILNMDVAKAEAFGWPGEKNWVSKGQIEHGLQLVDPSRFSSQQ